MKKRLLRAVLALAGLALLGVLILIFSPHCLILESTGYYCAGCGTQRMVRALLRGDLAGAARQNLLMLIGLPLCGLYLLAEAVRYVRGKRPLCRSRAFLPVAAGALALAGVFTVLRNLPGFQWLAPK